MTAVVVIRTVRFRLRAWDCLVVSSSWVWTKVQSWVCWQRDLGSQGMGMRQTASGPKTLVPCLEMSEVGCLRNIGWDVTMGLGLMGRAMLDSEAQPGHASVHHWEVWIRTDGRSQNGLFVSVGMGQRSTSCARICSCKRLTAGVQCPNHGNLRAAQGPFSGLRLKIPAWSAQKLCMAVQLEASNSSVSGASGLEFEIREPMSAGDSEMSAHHVIWCIDPHIFAVAPWSMARRVATKFVQPKFQAFGVWGLKERV